MSDPVERSGDVAVDPISGLPVLTVGRPISAAEVAEAIDDD
jgi:hypothetical protein